MKSPITILVCLVALILSEQLQAAAPPQKVDDRAIKSLLRKLDAEEFDIRQQADLKLRSLGKRILPILEAEFGRTGSMEVKWRISQMMKDMRISELSPRR
jgi:ABC-type transporter MlaC component